MGDASKLWAEGPIICNVDPKVMPHFSFHAKCNYCGEVIPFTSEVEREMRKHYSVKHRLYCNACKMSEFRTREELDAHLSAFHKGGICSNCHASFKLASAVAMHVEGPRNDCAVPPAYLVSSLRYIYHQKTLEVPAMTDTHTMYSPISCSSDSETTIQRLKEFKKALLLAHERAFNEMQQESLCMSDLPQLLGNQGVSDPQHYSLDRNKVASQNVSPPGPTVGDESSLHLSETVTSNPDIAALEMTESSSLQFPRDQIFQWTCSTCVDAKFTTLSKLLQHVEQKVRNIWWMSLHS